MMKYKGYMGKVEYDDKAKIFHGEVIGLKDVVTFQGTTVNEIEKAFKESIKDYLHWCEERGEQPEKPFSGKFNLRLPPELHAKLSAYAQAKGLSLNIYIAKTLERAIG